MCGISKVPFKMPHTISYTYFVGFFFFFFVFSEIFLWALRFKNVLKVPMRLHYIASLHYKIYCFLGCTFDEITDRLMLNALIFCNDVMTNSFVWNYYCISYLRAVDNIYFDADLDQASFCLLSHWIDPMLFICFQLMPLECKWKLLFSYLSRGQCRASAVHIWKYLNVWHVSNFVFLALILQLRLRFKLRQKLFNIQIYFEFHTTALQNIIKLTSCKPEKKKHCMWGDLYWDHITGDKISKEDR